MYGGILLLSATPDKIVRFLSCLVTFLCLLVIYHMHVFKNVSVSNMCHPVHELFSDNSTYLPTSLYIFRQLDLLQNTVDMHCYVMYYDDDNCHYHVSV